MATQLKNLKFGDYTIKGETDNGSTHFVLGGSDSFGYIETTPGGGSAAYHSIIDAVGIGSIDHWEFHGVAEKANTVTCYNASDPSTASGTYKLLVDGSTGVITAEKVD